MQAASVTIALQCVPVINDMWHLVLRCTQDLRHLHCNVVERSHLLLCIFILLRQEILRAWWFCQRELREQCLRGNEVEWPSPKAVHFLLCRVPPFHGFPCPSLLFVALSVVLRHPGWVWSSLLHSYHKTLRFVAYHNNLCTNATISSQRKSESGSWLQKRVWNRGNSCAVFLRKMFAKTFA